MGVGARQTGTRPEPPRRLPRQLVDIWRARPKLCAAMLAGLPRYIATVETAKHRVFQFLDASISPDNKLMPSHQRRSYILGVLSSQSHVRLVARSRQPPRRRQRSHATSKPPASKHSPSPPPAPSSKPASPPSPSSSTPTANASRPPTRTLTLTGMYNVLAKLRSGEAADRQGQDHPRTRASSPSSTNCTTNSTPPSSPPTAGPTSRPPTATTPARPPRRPQRRTRRRRSRRPNPLAAPRLPEPASVAAVNPKTGQKSI